MVETVSGENPVRVLARMSEEYTTRYGSCKGFRNLGIPYWNDDGYSIGEM